MARRVLVIDTYHVIKVFRDLDVSFEEIAALGCRIDGEPELKVTPALVAVWYEEEKEEREAGIRALAKKSEAEDD